MAEDTLNELQNLIDRLKAARKSGDAAAIDNIIGALLERAHGRLRGLAAKILGTFPRVRDDGVWQTTDVTAEVRARLAHVLRTVDLADTTHFFRLAGLKGRQLLIDLVRRLPRDERGEHDDSPPGAPARPVRDYQLVLTRMLELLQQLPEEQYAILDLEFVFGFNDREIAIALEVDETTIRRRRRKAYETISKQLRDEFPGPSEGPVPGE